MPLIQRRGSQSAQGFGEFLQTGATADPAYIENLFSTYVYDGTGTTQTITTNFNTADYQSLIWIKDRNNAGAGVNTSHCLTNTLLGAQNYLSTDTTAAITNDNQSLVSFGSNGFTVGTSPIVNYNGNSFVSWSFRKQAKFFDIVTYTGTGSVQNIPHSLGSVPGFIIVKKTSAGGNWYCWHKDLTSAAYYIQLNANFSEAIGGGVWNSTAPTSSVFTVGNSTSANDNGESYIAYLFATDAGGFGASGLENVISCGTYTGNGSSAGPTINVGYEPQFILVKKSIGSSNAWIVVDNIRELSYYDNRYLLPNDNVDESANLYFNINSNGFKLASGVSAVNGSGDKYIYITIRRGPMQTPTSGQNVFIPIARAGTGAPGASTAFGTVTDLVINKSRNATQRWVWTDRLRGATYELQSQNSAAEISPSQDVKSFATMTGYTFGTGGGSVAPVGAINTSGNNYIDYLFKRAPGFFDQVVYTGTGATTTINHNLTVVPELIIIKRMQTSTDWAVYNSTIGNTDYLVLNSTAASASSSTFWNNTSPTSSVFTVSTAANVNASGPYTAYLFATLSGVSKVGSYSGTGATITVDCGFTGGARFVMIKRTDTTGDWYMWDTARGMISGTDPYSLFNQTAVEVNADNVLSVATGFQVVGTGAGINASGGTYIFLAIA